MYNSSGRQIQNENPARVSRIHSFLRIPLPPALLLFFAAAWAAAPQETQPTAQPPTEPSQALVATPTFYRDVLPILQKHCQNCHRAGEIAPMQLTTYAQTRPFARAIADSATRREMPPWFADPSVGHFSRPSSLTQWKLTPSFPGPTRKHPQAIPRKRRLRVTGRKAG